MKAELKQLTESLTVCVVGSGLNDYDQRSAIGMARTWIEKRAPIKWNPDQIEYPKRDQLAKDLAALMAEIPADDEVYIDALLRARAVVNAPFQRDRFVGVKGAGVLNKPGPRKKDAK